MSTTFELIRGARELAETGSMGFDDDAGLDAWQANVRAWALASGDKFPALRAVLTRVDAEAEMFRAEAARLTAAANRATRIRERIEAVTEALLREHVELTGVRKVPTSDGGWIKLAERRGETVEVEDVAFLDPAYVRVKIEPDKVTIKAELKAGRPVAGAKLVEHTTESVTWSR